MGGRKTRDGNKSLFNLLEGGAKNKPKPTNAKVAKRMATGPSGPGNNLLRGLEKAAGVPHQDLGNYSVARTAKLVSVAMAKREASKAKPVGQKDLKYLGDRSVLQAAREGRAADRAADRAEFGPGRKVSAEQAAAESGARKQMPGGGFGSGGSRLPADAAAMNKLGAGGQGLRTAWLNSLTRESEAAAKREASAQKDLKYLGDRSVLQAAREGRAADRAADRAEFGPGRKVSAEQAAAESGARKQAGGGGGGGRGSGGGGGGKAQKRHPAGVPSGGRFA